MKRLTRFYYILFFAYALFLLVLLLVLTGCGRGETAPVETAAPSLPASPLGTWEEPERPYLALPVNSAGGRLYYIPVPDDLAARVEEQLRSGPRLADMELERLEGWGGQLPAGTDELAVYYASDALSFSPLYRNRLGDYGLDGASLGDTAEELLALAEQATGWDLRGDPADLAGLTRLELLYGDRVLVTVTDEGRLRSFEALLQSEIRPVSPSKTPNEWVELRCTGETETVSLLLDPETPRFWFPPCCYYRYNAYESTGVLPILTILGLDDWPAEIKAGPEGDEVAALCERLAPAPRPLWGMEELLYQLPTMDWAARSARLGSGEAVKELYALAEAVQEQEPSELSCLQILSGAGRADGALAEAYDFLLARLYERDPALYASVWRQLEPEQQLLALPLLDWDLSPEEAVEKIKLT